MTRPPVEAQKAARHLSSAIGDQIGMVCRVFFTVKESIEVELASKLRAGASYDLARPLVVICSMLATRNTRVCVEIRTEIRPSV